ncbi:macrophage mannose receptor 1-like [Hemibagrus wyckioides]|uniref:macrophage mannose receptor 1-like n=1 Tax=Hemibagrus wyckioides TaxID=337641 RepID=UPI00266C2C18|nr:macrophage mannose receptor 1-like [Hemibagrus wyckioides]XP_058240394.1 macrophage mannose receptor 1-like [Hemibagrus wyckioides]XP_058240395.1 macrophage mannose receptor 1-like [Hemibagrus wyckioides]XP_058240396.1 macrophage mannose receptor 1-like [Hemibagrus wyckioides]
MKQHLFILLFITGVLPVTQTIYRRFHLNLQGKTWSDAQAYCRAMYTDLATFENHDEAVRAQNIAQSQSLTGSTWIGLYNDVNSWRWSMGNEPLGSFRSWCYTNPDNYASNEYCAAVDVPGWFDSCCATTFPFICFDGRYTGTSSYIYISTAMIWSEAQSYCRQHHTDLASVRNSAESSVIMAMIPGPTWIGLFRDSWKWSDQANFTTITWATGEPNNAAGNENCACLINGLGVDVPCSRLKPFFCETVIKGKKQIARVKVQSDQDVKSPAVKAAILDKIMQMLSGHGNITVKWREQPDGLVFNKIKENTIANIC